MREKSSINIDHGFMNSVGREARFDKGMMVQQWLPFCLLFGLYMVFSANLCLMRLNHNCLYINIIHTYAPTADSSEEEAEEFYDLSRQRNETVKSI